MLTGRQFHYPSLRHRLSHILPRRVVISFVAVERIYR
ncbi:unnamed protein product [Arabidopsis halleri]